VGKTAVGLYDTTQEARQVFNDLISAGFSRNNIRILVGDNERRISEWGIDVQSTSSAAAMHSADAAIPLLVNSGVPRSDAIYYQEALHRGAALVSASTTDERIDEAVDIMSGYNLIDLQDRVRRWRGEGWREGSEMAATTTAEMRHDIHQAEGEQSIPIVEEELQVGKRQVEKSGGVRLRAHVTETPVEETVNLREEHVHVERRPVDRPVSSADIDAMQDKTLEFTETREEPVVNKQARVVEEVVVRKDVDTRQEKVHDTVRRTDVEVEKLGSDWNRFSTDFHNHYTTHYANSGLAYNVYEPAYRYGYTLGAAPEYRGRTWEQIEPEARRRWEREHHDSPWERFKDSVRYAWDRVVH
jgi:uncharacterized protein (TIGR02271 family)